MIHHQNITNWSLHDHLFFYEILHWIPEKIWKKRGGYIDLRGISSFNFVKKNQPGYRFFADF